MARAMRVKAMRAWRGMGNSGMYSALQGTGGLQARGKSPGNHCWVRWRTLTLPPRRERARL